MIVNRKYAFGKVDRAMLHCGLLLLSMYTVNICSGKCYRNYSQVCRLQWGVQSLAR